MHAQQIIDEGQVVIIHPSGEVYALRDGTLYRLKLNPRAIVNATMDECGVIDVEGLKPHPISKFTPRPVDSEVFNQVPI